MSLRKMLAKTGMARVGLVFAGALLVLAAGCADTKTEIEAVPTPVVKISGGVAVLVGETLKLSATTTDGETDGLDASHTWASDREDVATVAADGTVTGVAEGTAIITATGAETMVTGTWGIHVYVEGGGPGPEPTAKVVVGGAVSVDVGATTQLTAQTIDGTDSGYTWTSSDEAIATVDATGTVTGVAAGGATITAKGADTDATGSWGIYVVAETTEPTPKVVVSGPVSVEIASTIQLTALTVDGADSGYTWTSSDEAVATVAADGTVTGVAEGDATITATGADTDAAGTWGVHVLGEVEPPQPVVTVAGDFSVAEGDTLQLTATTTDGTDASYTWDSSNDAVATVDANGLVTGVTAGEAIITATGADTGLSGSHGVVVLAEGTVPGPEVPLLEQWQGSAHADATSEAFRHWDADGSVPTSCAKCHSSYGYQDFLGADGTAAGVVDNAAAIDSVITCVTCHNAEAIALDSVAFPSGVTVEGTGPSARCMTCHQGRSSTVAVDQKITDAAVADDDTVSAGLSFQNVHYLAAGATLYGGIAKGGYQYADKVYDVKFRHVEGYDACTACHNPHTLQLRVEGCAECHDGVEAAEDFHDIRMAGSLVDYDGDGDMAEGVYYEVQGLHEQLYAAIQAYATAGGAPIVYDSHAHPYFFADTNANGTHDEGEGAYASWTARLLRAAYNFQYVAKDPGGYAHNGKYMIELLYDSIEDLDGAAVGGARRVDAGHFAGSEEAWRHWDGEGEVPAGCARCHSDGGLETYLLTGGTTAEEPSNGMLCVTCHDGGTFPALKTAADVTFPSGLTVDTGSNLSNLCMQCHQGREAGVTLQARLEGLPEDEVAASLRFVNVHYFAAGATRWGAEAGGGYEYEGNFYNGYFQHTTTVQQCADCHDEHALTIKYDVCATCHSGVADEEDLHDIRMPGSTVDYDNDGDVEEGIAMEIATLQDELYAAMQQYATEIVGGGIVYDAARYPYWFTSEGAGFASWTPRLLKAAYNYQYVAKDPGAFAHNARYIVQLLFDSITDLGTQITVPEPPAARNPGPHFDATSEAFRHWDGDGEVAAGCARCHAGEPGLVDYLADYTDSTEPLPVSYGFTCETCHTGADYAGAAPLRAVEKVVFPGGTEVENTTNDPSFLCMTCHQGRESKATIDAAIAASQRPVDPVALGFKNIHYLSAGATLYGSQGHVGYEYEGKTYAGKWGHYDPQSTQCTYCHQVTGEAHTYEPRLSGCACHDPETEIRDVRWLSFAADFDGDGDATEQLLSEVETLGAALYAAIRAEATSNGTPLAYDSSRHPYFFNDPDDDGVVNAGATRFANWTPELVKAAHNFQMSLKEPGAWAHNFRYVAQLLIDSIEDLGGDVSGYTRP